MVDTERGHITLTKLRKFILFGLFCHLSLLQLLVGRGMARLLDWNLTRELVERDFARQHLRILIITFSLRFALYWLKLKHGLLRWEIVTDTASEAVDDCGSIASETHRSRRLHRIQN